MIYLLKVLRSFIYKSSFFVLSQCRCFFIRGPKKSGWVPGGIEVFDRIKNNLKKNGINVLDYTINVDKYKKYLIEAAYTDFKDYFVNPDSLAFAEKTLEHYICADLLSLNKNDVYIDIASFSSPVHIVYSKLFGCKTYRQDLCFPKGFEGTTIGGDAGAMPVPSGFASKMGMHCSLEHFEGTSDTQFIIEAQRVLKSGGKLCIIPLYLAEMYAIQTNPMVLPLGGIPFDKDALLYCTPEFHNRHGRHYDVAHLYSRLIKHINNAKLTVYYITNEKDVSEQCYMKFAAVLEKD